MALIYMDGFDAGDQTARWTTIGNGTMTRSLVAGRYGTGQALRLSNGINSNPNGVTRYFQPTTTLYFGAALQLSGSNNSGAQLLHFGSFGGANIGLWLTASYGLQLWRHISSFEFSTSSGTALTSASDGLVNGEWTYLEAMVTVADAGGRFVLRKNGNIIIDYTGDTRTSGATTETDHVILSGIISNGPTCTWDDLYIANNSGTANNNFQGDIEVKALLPDANGNYSGFTGSDGNSVDNYQLIDDTSMADYVASSVVGTKDSYNLPNLTGVNVRSVQTVVQGNQASGGSAAVRPFVRISGTDYPTTTQYLGQQNVTTSVLDVSPATSTAWGLAELNGTELGVEVV